MSDNMSLTLDTLLKLMDDISTVYSKDRGDLPDKIIIMKYEDRIWSVRRILKRPGDKLRIFRDATAEVEYVDIDMDNSGAQIYICDVPKFDWDKKIHVDFDQEQDRRDLMFGSWRYGYGRHGWE